MPMDLTFLGTSAGMPTRWRNASGLAVQIRPGTGWYLVDCGEGTQPQVQRAGLSLHDLEAICISHVHGDHCYGLPGLLDSAGMLGRQKPLTLIAPAALWQWLQATHGLTDVQLPYTLEFVDVCTQPAVLERPGLRISSHELAHGVPCHAFRFEVQTSQRWLDSAALSALRLPPGPQWGALRRGENVLFNNQWLHSRDYVQEQTERIVAVLGGDNAEPQRLRHACADAQLLVHEATFSRAALAHARFASGHSCAHDVAVFAQSVGLPNLVLTHFSQRHHSDAEQAALLHEAQAQYQGTVVLARDLQTWELAADGTLRHKANHPAQRDTA